MKFVTPSAEELSYLRADPVLIEQELDCRPETAEAMERAVGFRAGRTYWRSTHDHLYALELADLGRGRPSQARVFGHWDRFEPRPSEHEIRLDLVDFCLWVAEVAPNMDPDMVDRLARTGPNGVGLSRPQGAVLRTPDDRFANLPGFPYEPRYLEIEGLRMAYVEHGAGDPILMLHGEPTWGYLYRRMIPPLAEIGRAVVPDLIGFGRSDKPTRDNEYSYKSHVRWMRAFIKALDLKRITLVCQDWGGPIGLRVLAHMPERFSRAVIMNTGIPDGSGFSKAFMAWRRLSQKASELDVAQLVRGACHRKLTDDEAAAYGAPFPSREYQACALLFPRLVPIRLDHPGAYDNRVAIETLKTLDLPVLPVFAEGDAITRQAEGAVRAIFKNTAPTVSVQNAGHFLQEDAGEEIARHIRAWMEETKA